MSVPSATANPMDRTKMAAKQTRIAPAAKEDWADISSEAFRTCRP